MRRKTKQRIVCCMLSCLLATSTIITGCSQDVAETPTVAKQATQNSAAVAADLKDKYESTQANNYSDGEFEVPRDFEFLISYDFDPIESKMNEYPQIASLYYDAELTQPVPSTYDWASDDKKSYTISPWETPSSGLMAFKGMDYPYGETKDSDWLFYKGPNADWGNVGTLYLATQVDLTTGKKLDKPSVQVITLKGELDTPRLSLDMSNNGQVQFTWNKIEGAKAYYVVEFSTNDEGAIISRSVIGHTDKTAWSSESLEEAAKDSLSMMNSDFKTYYVSQDDWLSKPMAEEFGKKYDPADGAVISEPAENRLYAVLAVNEQGTSMYSNTKENKEIASLAPCVPAYNMEKLSDEGFSGYVKGVPMMPSHRWIVMCNGDLSQRIVNYDFDKAVTKEVTWYNETKSGKYEAEAVDVIEVPYIVEGTLFAGTLVISEYDKDKWENQLKAIEERQESLRNKTGDVKREVVVEDEKDKPNDDDKKDKPEPSKGESTGTEIVVEGKEVTANSALSEYLALHMINGEETVDLTAFPEALDQQYLADAWSEAFYQNPLVLGVSEVLVSRDGKALRFLYEDDQATRESKQEKLTQKAEQVVSEIISDSMSAREKEFAINQYLCDTVTYDDAALLNAEQYSFMKVDSEFYDSFTAYGALIDGVGVCASYAASFKLLADTAGLNSVVVTGYLDGTLAHAWNRVELENGQWATIDTTNNDIDILSNALLNAPDTAIATTLVEDDLWVMDSVLDQFSNESEDNEFYHVSDLFFNQTEVVNQLIDQLESNDTVVLRTDYALNDAQFYEIGGAVVEATGNTDLMGCYWMGVIVLTNDASTLL